MDSKDHRHEKMALGRHCCMVTFWNDLQISAAQRSMDEVVYCWRVSPVIDLILCLHHVSMLSEC